jgi:hypothetical protein
MVGICNSHSEMGNLNKILVRNPEGEMPLDTFRFTPYSFELLETGPLHTVF